MSGSPASAWRRACAVSWGCGSSATTPARPVPQAASQIAVQTAGGGTIALSFPGDRCDAQPGVRVERDGPSVTDGACLAARGARRSLALAGGGGGARSAPRLVAPRYGDPRGDCGRHGRAGRSRRLVLARLPGAPGDSRSPRWRMRPIHASSTIGSPRSGVSRSGRRRGRPSEAGPAASPSDHRRPGARNGGRLAGRPRVRSASIRIRSVSAIAPCSTSPTSTRASSSARPAARPPTLTSADGDSWRVVAPAGATADRTNAARVVGALGNLRVGGVRPRAEGAHRSAGGLPDNRHPTARRGRADSAHARALQKERGARLYRTPRS